MSKSWNRTETWVTLIVLGVGAVIAAIAGMWIYVSATARPLHPDAQDVPSVAAANAAHQWTAAIEQARQIVRSALAEQNLPGVSVAVGVGNNIVWAEGFGWANIENKEAVSPDTRFRIGTLSTALTSAAAGLLLERERLQLDEQIQTYVPEFAHTKWPVTLRQVMAHVAGIRSDSGDEGPLFGERCDRPLEALQHFDSTPRFEPGTEYRYSNFGWIVVSAAIETAAKEPFLTFMQKEVFEPLGMHDTMPDSGAESTEGQSTSYFPRFAADPRYGPDVMRPLNLSCYSGASVFVSTPSDLVRFALAVNNARLLKPETVALLQTPQRLPSGQDTGYGLGWDLETATISDQQTRVVGHDGELLGGNAASLMTFPELRPAIVVAVLANTSYADTFDVGERISQAFVDPMSQ